MAITITKEPSGIYPIYNDFWIEFSSDLANNYKAEIDILPLPSFHTFIIYPNSNGVYLFNAKEALKTLFNEDGFKDSNFFTDSYYKNIDNIYLSKQIYIKVYSQSSFEATTKTYELYKAIKQIEEDIYSNEFELLTATKDGVNHYLTYFEGFPFHFDIKKATVSKDIYVKSLNSGNSTELMTPTETGSFRINIDKGGANNWTSDNFLPLFDNLNRLEVYSDSIFKSNIYLNKKKKCSGIYLKWFNSSGGFSHFLFDEFYNKNINAKDIDEILNNDFENVGNKTGLYNSIGKETKRSLTLKTKYTPEEYEVLKDIISSPFVQIYTSMQAYAEGRFVNVSVNQSMTYFSKKYNNDFILTVELPTLTATY